MRAASPVDLGHLKNRPLEREKPASGLAGSRGAAYPYAPWESLYG